MKKDLTYYLSLNYPITIETYTEGKEVHYSLEIPDLPGCGAEATTLNEALEKLNDAKELWIEASLKRNLHIPEPVSEDDFSGKFLLRIPTKLHMALSKQAKKEGLSLNQYVKSILEIHTVLAYEKYEMEERYEKPLKERGVVTSSEEELITDVSSASSTSIFPFPKAKEISLAQVVGF